MRLDAGGDSTEGITSIVQSSDPFTYFRETPVRVCHGAALDDGTLSIAMLRRSALRDMPTIAARVLGERFRPADHHQIDHYEDVTSARLASISLDEGGRPRSFPFQVDGDYIGDYADLELGIEPGALTVVA